jgi:hypothetical protein
MSKNVQHCIGCGDFEGEPHPNCSGIPVAGGSGDVEDWLMQNSIELAQMTRADIARAAYAAGRAGKEE